MNPKISTFIMTENHDFDMSHTARLNPARCNKRGCKHAAAVLPLLYVRAGRPGCAANLAVCWRAQHAQMFHIIFRLASGRHATCIIMAHVHDGRALRDSPLSRLNRINGTLLRLPNFHLSPSPCHASAAGRALLLLPLFISVHRLLSCRCAACCTFCELCPVALGELLFSCFQTHSYSVPPLSHRCATAAL